MSLSDYAEACKEFVSELKESLTKEDVNGLRSECATVGIQGVLDWMSNNMPMIEKYVGWTPLQRARSRGGRDPELKRMLVLGSIWCLERGAALLEQIDQQSLSPGGSYRDMAVRAGRAYIQTFYVPRRVWPFKDPDPFK
jgi:hypothetical protein